MKKGNFKGVLCPVLTPFKADLSPDVDRFVDLCKWMLGQGVDGLAVFGTTSEANSMSADERADLLDALIDGGVPAEKLMPGTGCCAISDSIRLTKQAMAKGCGGVLMLPPFYYKTVNDDGLFAAFSEVIQQVGESGLQIYLYHIPPQAVVPISLDLIGRLVKEYPDTVVGLKDSSGDFKNTVAVINEFPEFSVFPGSETFLLDGLRAGGVGCITASGNINPAGIRKVYENWQTDQADALQARISEVRAVVQSYPLIPALKAMIAHFHDDPAWAVSRPPINPLPADKAQALLADLKAIDFVVEPK